MSVTLLKVTNIGLKITDSLTIPIIKAVIKTDFNIETIDKTTLNLLIEEIYSRSSGLVTVSHFYTGSNVEPFHSNAGNWEYGVVSSYRFWGSCEARNELTASNIAGLTYKASGAYIVRLSNIQGYATWLVEHAIIFVDENNNLYTYSNWIDMQVLYDFNPGITDIDGRIAVAAVQPGFTIKPPVSGTTFTHTSNDITGDIANEIDPEDTDPYKLGGNTDVSEMTGDFDDSSDPIDFPSLPSLGATDTGLITLYNPSLAEVKALASYMWTNPAFDISAWKKIFADPIDAILGLSIVPVAVPDGGQRHIAVGNLFTDVVMNVAAQQYIELQCGALNVNEFWSSYLDYEPYTKAEIYLPYCGVHQLSVDDIMDKTVEVRYHIDILTGSCCAYVKCGDSVLYQFIGQCSSTIPVASGDFSEIIGSALNAALAVGTLAATGGASAPFSVPEITANAVNILKEKIQKSGSLSGTGGMLAIQKPYLILTRPRQAVPANQNHYTGYPSFITENLSELSGYTEIEDIHLENVSATDSELNEIVTLLEGGVIF